jgi:hypothetical protein
MPEWSKNVQNRDKVDESIVDTLQHRGIAGIRVFITLFLCVCALVIACLANPSQAFSAQNQGGSSAAQEATTITDTQNLLGSGLTRVSDEVETVRRTTGVTVDLLYLPTFDTNMSAQQWAEEQLRSTHPRKNTVMLALASQKGQMVVVVSDNSDQWLRNNGTVSALSDAAAKPLNAASPDWSGAALSLCDEIVAQYRQAQHAPVRRAWLIVGIVLGVLVVIGIIVLIVVGARRGLFAHRSGVHAGAHAGTPSRRRGFKKGKKTRSKARHAL